MNVKAEAYQEYNQAAVLDKLITGLPEVVKALASPLSNVDRITVVSTGDGNSAGLHKITSDLTQIAAQVPELFEALSGMKMSDLLGKITTIGANSKNRGELPPPAQDEKAPDAKK
jgi:flotillin